METFVVVVVLIAAVAFAAYKVANKDKSGGSYRDHRDNGKPR